MKLNGMLARKYDTSAKRKKFEREYKKFCEEVEEYWAKKRKRKGGRG